MSSLLSWDQSAFFFLNQKLTSPVLDWLMPVLTNFSYFQIPILVALTALFIWGGKKGRWLVVLGVIAVGLADLSAYQLLKPIFARPRPCQTLEGVRLLVNCGGFYGFPSNHACNFFGTAAVILFFYPRVAWGLFGLAILVGWSRIYVGVHYPLDVLMGGLWGTLLAVAVVKGATAIFKGRYPSLQNALNQKPKEPHSRPVLEPSQPLDKSR